MNRLRYLSYSLVLIICAFIFNGVTNAYTEYKIGDEITYNDIKFYVINDSSSDEESVTMLKAEPLTVDEVSSYGVGYINNYTYNSRGRVWEDNGYGGMAYYTSLTCRFVDEYNFRRITSGCSSEYISSDIKYVVDNWSISKINEDDLYTDSLGYKSRLITINDLENIGYSGNEGYYKKSDDIPTWIYNSKYWYWTMTPMTSSTDVKSVYYVNYDGLIGGFDVMGGTGSTVYGNAPATVRPVITLKKSAIKEAEEEIIDGNIDNKDSGNIKSDTNEIIDKKDNNTENINVFINKKEVKTSVNVPNTFEKVSIVFILIGIVLVSISTIILIKNRNIIKK